ncbi:AGAP006725-PA-like protein [Anopheles sinensis]|uniref:Carboxylic ester hydrolase n=1 Tax=Anopheles sinensis TaxID=74873 RepID=A0A084WLJ9_ANOSI|nr:AGAP006725-PA-like protein [Anopheles sinensis]
MEANRCTVRVSSGVIQGVTARLPNGDPCFRFKGIPYAEPPVGSRRFRPPQPFKQRDEPLRLDCTVERCVSLASSYLPPDAIGSEDCLFLNVYTPINPTVVDGGSETSLPVMVWLHGGAFCTGSADSTVYDPEWLVAQGVVVVTVNYRLGPAGFLCLPSVGIYGNMGLKDQRMALEWVRENIGRFGGDAGNVTLFGESAGAVSTHLHCLSERSRHLFHKAICQSGVSTSPITFQNDPEVKARRLAEYFGCPEGASDDLVLETLMNVAPDMLAKHQKEALTTYEKTLDSVYPFRPTVEVPDADEPIVTEDVMVLLKRPNSVTIPMIIGVTNEEALYKINTFRQHLERYKAEVTRFLPASLNVPSEERLKVAQDIVEFYCGTTGIAHSTELQMSRIFTDIFYLIPAVQAAELQLKHQNGSIFFYHFTAETELNKFRKQWKVPEEHRGASHADDVCYLFRSPYFNTDAIERQSTGWQLRETMCQLWASFAKTSSPGPTTNGGVVWTPLPERPVPSELQWMALEIGNQGSAI